MNDTVHVSEPTFEATIVAAEKAGQAAFAEALLRIRQNALYDYHTSHERKAYIEGFMQASRNAIDAGY